MRDRLLTNGTVLLPDGFHRGTDVRVEEDRIARIGRALPAHGAHVVDASGLTITPGLIDIHVHGAAGAMCEEAHAEGIERISAALARTGVTGFLPTIATLPPDRLRAAVEAVGTVVGREPGARILGIHLEGPYLSPLRAGAQAVAGMRLPSIEEFDDLWDRSEGGIRLIAVAPEIEGAVPFTAAARERGAAVAVGHSNAAAEEMLLGIEAGATHVTHLFNAMREMHHREPGPAGVALTEDAVSVELICDGHHLAPRVVDLVWRAKPRGKIVLVSDAVGALGLPDGDYSMFGVACTIGGGAVRLRQGGNLAGSCQGLDRAIANVTRWLPMVPLEEVFFAASSAPAAVIGEEDAGTIAEGRTADLALWDRDLRVAATVCRGVLNWVR